MTDIGLGADHRRAIVHVCDRVFRLCSRTVKDVQIGSAGLDQISIGEVRQLTQLSEPPADHRPAEQQEDGELKLPPPGWYPDPGEAPIVRWWDGTQWTSAVSRADRGVLRTHRRRSTGLERIVYGLAITAAVLPILPAASPGCGGELNVDACQRVDAKSNIWLGSVSTGLAVAGLVIAIYALRRRNVHRRAMTAMSAVFGIGFFLLIGLTNQMTQATYGPLPSLKGYDTGPLLIMTGAGLLAGFVLIGMHHRIDTRGHRGRPGAKNHQESSAV